MAAYKAGKISKGAKVGIFAETEVREKTFREDEFPAFKKYKGHDLEAMFDIQFRCYQGDPSSKENFDMIICDEISEMLTVKYHKPLFFNGPKIGLDATIPEALSVYREDLPYTMVNKVNQGKKKREAKVITDLINKGEMLDMYMPVVYELSYEDAVKKGIVAPSKVFIMNHNLDTTIKNMKPFKSKDFKTTEAEYWRMKYNLGYNYSKPVHLRMLQLRELSQFISHMPSKFKVIENLLGKIKDPTIIFNQRLDPLRNLDNVHVAESDNTQELIDKFNKGKINTIASALKLKRGITLKNCSFVIIATPYQNFHHFEQMRGRAVRLDYEGKIANIVVFRTHGTYEDKWVERMTKVYDMEGNLKRQVYMGESVTELTTKKYLD